MMSEDNSDLLAAMQGTLEQMNYHLTTMCVNVEDLKRTHPPGGQGAQLPDNHQPGTLPSNATPSVISTPDNCSEYNDNVVTCLTWNEQMELEDGSADVDQSGKHPKGEKLCLMKVEESTENFLREGSTTISNEDRKDLHSKFIVPDISFTVWINLWQRNAQRALNPHQALFLDAAGPLTGLLDKINRRNPISVDDVEAAVKSCFNLHGKCLFPM